jgi:hypothetical protein
MNRPAFFATLSAVPLAGQDLTGTWEVASQTQRGARNLTLTLVQDGGGLTGTVTLTMGGRRGGGGGGGGEQTIEITDGEVDGSSFSFAMTIARGGNSFTQAFSGTFEGDSMEGTIEGGRGGGQPFTGARGG